MTGDEQPLEPEAEREIVIRRVFDVPARVLFLANSRPEHMRRWFGPEGWPLTLCEMDFRVGGRYRFAMTGPDGTQGRPFGGRYLEIEPDRRIVYENSLEVPGAETFIVTLTFEEHGGQTTMTMRSLFPTVAMKNEFLGRGFVEGVESGFDQLATVATELRDQGSR